ncbi:hypothetical protein C8Q74DRAFT_1220020 [Fomes fomentarius]|nr:hypothetical protein C8Q74DRAFT_1220020 [Fomes fomentarius]
MSWQTLRGEGMQAHGRTLVSDSRSFPGDECLRFEGGGTSWERRGDGEVVAWGQESGKRACGDACPCAPASGAYEKVITFDGGSGTLAGARAGKKGPVDRMKMWAREQTASELRWQISARRMGASPGVDTIEPRPQKENRDPSSAQALNGRPYEDSGKQSRRISAMRQWGPWLRLPG